jgi:N6-L-threonylcarbamoyladenine synthase
MDESDSKVDLDKTSYKPNLNRRTSHSEDGEIMRSQTIPSERHFQTYDESFANETCYAIQKAVIDVLVDKTVKASEKFNCKTILVGGGVTANQTFIDLLRLKAKDSKQKADIFAPAKIYCTDNAAMIGAYALVNGTKTAWQEVKADPELYFDELTGP